MSQEKTPKFSLIWIRLAAVSAGAAVYYLIFFLFDGFISYINWSAALGWITVVPFSLAYPLLKKRYPASGVHIFFAGSLLRLAVIIMLLLFGGELNIKYAIAYLIAVACFLSFQLVTEAGLQIIGPELRKRKSPQSQSYE